MVKTISRNLSKRLQLLRESNNYLQVLINNRVKIPNRLLEEHKEQLKVCKELLRKELIKTNVKDLLTTIKDVETY